MKFNRYETKYLMVLSSLMAEADSLIFDSCLLESIIDLEPLSLRLRRISKEFDVLIDNITLEGSSYILGEIEEALSQFNSYIEILSSHNNNVSILKNEISLFTSIGKELNSQKNRILMLMDIL